MEQIRSPDHVVVFPLPFQGPMNSMLKLAELLCLSGLHITFVVTEHIYGRLLRTTNIESAFKRYDGFRLQSIPDGLPADHPRVGAKVMEVFDSLNSKAKPIFRDMITSDCLSSETGRGPVTCVVADGMLGFTCDVCRDIGIPIFYVRSVSPCSLWISFCLPKLIESGEIPIQGNMDELVRNVPGMESFLRRRDLPSFCRSDEYVNTQQLKFFLTEIEENPRADGLILNTFDELEGSLLTHMRTICPNIYTIGPIHENLKTKLSITITKTTTTINLWKEDLSCLKWLDEQKSKSVLYISFGSLVVLKTNQILEIWHGLVNSGIKFLWVMRPDSIGGGDSDDWKSEIPAELLKGTQERGCIVEWAPQDQVLSHQAIGGFLTHSGWNSTLESISAGVPMICWPFFADQQINSRYVSEVWKLGLDMKDTCDRVVVEKNVKELMEVRKEEFTQRATAMAEFVGGCLSEGGSSYRNLDRLVKDIESMSRRCV